MTIGSRNRTNIRQNLSHI